VTAASGKTLRITGALCPQVFKIKSAHVSPDGKEKAFNPAPRMSVTSVAHDLAKNEQMFIFSDIFLDRRVQTVLQKA